jgi:hypothetical protein
VEVAFEHPAVALRERTRVRVSGAFGFAFQEKRAQVFVKPGAILQLREAEGNGEKRLNLDHPAAGRLRIRDSLSTRVDSPKENGGPVPAVSVSNNRWSCDQKSMVTVAKTWRPRAS